MYGIPFNVILSDHKINLLVLCDGFVVVVISVVLAVTVFVTFAFIGYVVSVVVTLLLLFFM